MTITAQPSPPAHAEQHLGSYGLLRMDITTDLDDVSTTYRLRGPHVTGSVVLSPGTTVSDPTDPDRSWSPDLHILFGTAPVTPAHRRADPLTVNRIELARSSRVFFAHLDAGSPVPTSRRDKNTNTVPLPPATRRHAQAVLAAVVAHWRASPDREALEDAGRKIAAVYWLTRYSKDLHQLNQTLTETQAARDKTSRRADALRAHLASTERAAAA